MNTGRAYLDYTKAAAVPAGRFVGFDPNIPIAGHYRFRMRSGGALCGVRIWFGPPLDPVTGEELDRSLRWQALVNDEPVDLDRVWPKCAADLISEEEYRHFCRVQDWARENAPDSPMADPRRKADPLSSPILF